MSAAAQHITVLLEEAVAALAVRPDGVYVDATFGRGGHSRRILAALGAEGRLYAFDRDPEAVAAAAGIVDPRFSIAHAPFGDLERVLKEKGVAAVDGVLLDLGVSSPQLDEGRRGFSFRQDAALDMRMDTTRGETAAEWLAAAEEREIAEVIRNYGEERFAKQIAKALVAARNERPVDTTRRLAEIVAQAVRTREPGQHPATRSFQAVRIHVNRELEELARVLPQCLSLLAPGGRLAVISFHSLEDRVVKHFMRNEANPAAAVPVGLPLTASQLPQPRLRLVGKPVRAGEAEVTANPRARSAVLRVAEKLPEAA